MKLIFLSLLTFNFTYLISQKADFKVFNCQPIIEDFIWAAETEVSNIQYREFLSSLKGTSAYKKMLPDTNCWRERNISSPYTEYYFRHPAYSNYPVVGITYEQAQAFCDWLTIVLNESYQKNSKHPAEKLIVRLPSKQEWITAAKGGDPNAEFPWSYPDVRNLDKKYKGSLMANFIRGKSDYMGVAGQLNDNADITAPVQSYWPNGYGLYNMSGNVSEMIADKGQTKGGSWASYAKNIQIDAENEFPEDINSDSRIGFRYFIEVVSFKNEYKKMKEYTCSAKEIESMIVYIPGKTFNFVGKTEVTNRLFNYYLKDTKRVKKSKTNNALWNDIVNYPAIWNNDYDNKNQYLEFPVVNITKEEAVEFCKWLTKKYNSFPKIKYKGIQFRLPDEKEWEFAACGGLDHSPYPWGGPYIRNAKGSLLCNHSAVKYAWINYEGESFLIDGIDENEKQEVAGWDGYEILAPSISYFPNGWGLYNMSGNVAEIIDEKDIIKGGSWNSFENKVLIQSKEKYTGACPTTGFRIFGSYDNSVSKN
jgi:formylglycine-generating enzyme required for sulfatase activity